MAKSGPIMRFNDINILASEVGKVPKTVKFTQAGAPAANAQGRRVYQGGTAFPANDATGIGVVYYDVDVTDGDREGSILEGAWLDPLKLPTELTPEFLAAVPGIHLRKRPAAE